MASSIGHHCIIELYECDRALLNDAEHVTRSIRAAAESAGATLLKEVSHSFDPQGVTALALLAESHISVHTWPELGYAAADVFTCGQTCNPDTAAAYLVKAFRSQRHEVKHIHRGAPPQVAMIMREAEGVSKHETTGTADPDSDEGYQCRVLDCAQTTG